MIDIDNMPKEELAGHMNMLKQNFGWQIICQIVEQGELKSLRSMLEGSEIGGQKIESFAEFQQIQYKISCLKEILSLPDQLLKDMVPTDDSEDEVDPYYQNAADIHKDAEAEVKKYS